MKQLLTACLLLLLFTSCQQKNAESPTAPASGTAEAVSRTKYRIIFLEEPEKHNVELYLRDFETIVNQAIAEGWQPVGGVTTAGFAAVPMQAMIKTE